MIKIDWKRYVTNRMWFGYWFNFSWLKNPHGLNRYEYGSWRRDDRYKWIPVTLVRNTFGERTAASLDPACGSWGQQYDTK